VSLMKAEPESMFGSTMSVRTGSGRWQVVHGAVEPRQSGCASARNLHHGSSPAVAARFFRVFVAADNFADSSIGGKVCGCIGARLINTSR